jgi:hypothetical protein
MKIKKNTKNKGEKQKIINVKPNIY